MPTTYRPQYMPPQAVAPPANPPMADQAAQAQVLRGPSRPPPVRGQPSHPPARPRGAVGGPARPGVGIPVADRGRPIAPLGPTPMYQGAPVARRADDSLDLSNLPAHERPSAKREILHDYFEGQPAFSYGKPEVPLPPQKTGAPMYGGQVIGRNADDTLNLAHIPVDQRNLARQQVQREYFGGKPAQGKPNPVAAPAPAPAPVQQQAAQAQALTAPPPVAAPAPAPAPAPAAPAAPAPTGPPMYGGRQITRNADNTLNLSHIPVGQRNAVRTAIQQKYFGGKPAKGLPDPTW